ncbi:MAG: hypothetical protein JSW24_02565 [Dehalococcoidia bacterium]|jgi:hypothetical protein|nr:MAG: hypothetical protein JSW24_02565 [Dehalococcoidia bacterium]
MAVEQSNSQQYNFAESMGDLINLQIEMNALVSSKMILTATEKAGLKDKIKAWLKKVQEIAQEVNAREYTIGAEIGFPPKVSASFTWET